MSTWTIPTVPEDKLDDPPPIAIAITLLAVTVVVGVAIAIANWEIGKPLLSAKIVTRAFIAPLLTWGILCTLIYTGYETAIHRVALWNFLCRDTYAHWRQWTHTGTARRFTAEVVDRRGGSGRRACGQRCACRRLYQFDS